MTLIEITLVMGLMLALASIITYSISSMSDWKKGRSAAEKLKSVYVAQKSYLADHPTSSFSTLTATQLVPYLPGRPGAMPTQKSLTDQSLTIDVTEMPPIFTLSSSAYDPSDSDSDSLWDVGNM